MRKPLKRDTLFANTVLPAALVALAAACEPAPQPEAEAPEPEPVVAEPQVDAAQQFADLVAVDANPVALTGVKLIDGTGAAARTGQTVVIADGRSSAELSAETSEFVSIAGPTVALTGVKVIDGTGAGARTNQTVVIEGNRIAAAGPAGTVEIPSGAEVRELPGHTVIPGLIGLHNHSFYTAAGGRAAQLSFSAPRLYLASGLTTIRTTGARAPYEEINLRDEIQAGLAVEEDEWIYMHRGMGLPERYSDGGDGTTIGPATDEVFMRDYMRVYRRLMQTEPAIAPTRETG